MPNVDIDFEAFHGDPAPERLLYDDDRALRAFAPLRPFTLVSRTTIDVGGRPWTLHFESLPSFHDAFYNRLPQLILVVGLLVTLVLSQTVFLLARQARERRRQTAALQFQATHDALTHLPNREQLLARMQDALADARTGIDRFALLLIDLNGFKEVNDTLGHQSGDRLLPQIGPRLERLVSAGELVARLGGDEFALWVALPEGPTEAGARAQRVLETLQQPFALEQMTVQIDASIGIALHPEHGRDSQTLMRCADVAMYQAKRSHHSHAVYAPEQDLHSPRLLSVTGELGEAMAADQLVLHYQPILRIRDRCVIGLEALLRWNHPREGLIPPGEFMPQVERSTLVRPVTHWVIEQAVRQCRAWRDRGLHTAVAVNISARNLLDNELPDAITRILDSHRASPDCLEIELTESAIITDPERALVVLSRLSDAGVGISIDDFGTGYSSLAHLKRLPVSRLKIDRTFVLDMPRDDNDAIIVHSTVNLAHNLGLQVIAEGVENSEVLDLLAIIGCDHAQGFFLCPPLPADPSPNGWSSGRRGSLPDEASRRPTARSGALQVAAGRGPGVRQPRETPGLEIRLEQVVHVALLVGLAERQPPDGEHRPEEHVVGPHAVDDAPVFLRELTDAVGLRDRRCDRLAPLPGVLEQTVFVELRQALDTAHEEPPEKRGCDDGQPRRAREAER